MFPCPKGHQSRSGDYCDECGAPIGALGSTAGSAGGALGISVAGDAGSNSLAGSMSSSMSSSTPDVDAATGSGELCPDCSTERAGRFCEVCGHDFVLTGYRSGPAPDEPAGMPASAAPTPGAPAAPGAPPPSSPQPTTPDAPDMPDGAAWRLVVTVDPAYYERMRAQADADTEPIALPAYVPQRRFTLERQRILIGRRSRSRGIEPDVDLSGPPSDPAVSHAQALLLREPDGGWAIVDLGSSNGTYINTAADPVPANVPVPLADGDVICVGAWTALTLRRG